MTKDIAAETIVEEILYLTGKAILEDDDEMFLTCICLPQLMETAHGKRLLKTESEVRSVLADVRRYMRQNDYLDLVRTVVSAEFLDTETVGATHVSRMTTGDGSSDRAPYPVYSVIRRFGTSWKMISSLYAILDDPEHNSALLPDETITVIQSKA